MTFLLKAPGGRPRHQQYAVLSERLTPLMQACGISEPAGWIANKLDFRGAVFWCVPAVVAEPIKRMVERYHGKEVETHIWRTVSRSFVDCHGRRTWQQVEVQHA